MNTDAADVDVKPGRHRRPHPLDMRAGTVYLASESTWLRITDPHVYPDEPVYP